MRRALLGLSKDWRKNVFFRQSAIGMHILMYAYFSIEKNLKRLYKY